MTTMYTTPIKTTQNDLDLVGGKGRSLARMSCADFDVPGGFLVTTDAYKKFIADSDLKSKINLEVSYSSKSAKEKIEKAGGTLTVKNSK